PSSGGGAALSRPGMIPWFGFARSATSQRRSARLPAERLAGSNRSDPPFKFVFTPEERRDQARQSKKARRIRKRTLFALLACGGRFSESQPCRMPGCFRTRGNTELAIDILDIARHCVLRDSQCFGHLAITQPPRDQTEHLAFAYSQIVFRRGRPGSLEMLHDPAR